MRYLRNGSAADLHSAGAGSIPAYRSNSSVAGNGGYICADVVGKRAGAETQFCVVYVFTHIFPFIS